MKFFSRLVSAQAFGFDQGKATSRKGEHSRQLLSELSSLGEKHSISSGEIWVSGDNRVTFSEEIPANLHQRFRNIIRNS
jgi:hypothetical protein